MAKKCIGILTGGGDVPGLNSVIKTVTYRSSENDIEVVGLRRGWEGLTHLNLDDPASKRRYVIPLDRENARTVDRHGGTVLHSSRTDPSKMQKLPDHLAGKDVPAALGTRSSNGKSWDLSGQVLANLAALGIEHLIAIGGDAIKHIDAAVDCFEDVEWSADAHEVAGLVLGQEFRREGASVFALTFFFADCETANGEAIKWHGA